MYRSKIILARTFSRELVCRGPSVCRQPRRDWHALGTFYSIHRLTGDLLAVDFLRLFVINALSSLQNCTATLAIANPFSSADQGIATWFHARLTPAFVTVLDAFTEFGSGEWIGIVLFVLVAFFVWKRLWPSLVTLIIAVPGGMLLNEWVKVQVHRQRPFTDGPFVNWSGYSFASGHTIAATLLYGQLLLFLLPLLKERHVRNICVLCAASLVLLVGFSRIALGAHFLTDVLGAIVFGVIWLILCMLVGNSMRRRPLASAVAVPAAQNFTAEIRQ
jgi:membrane-associated phospholipid phosphatase